MNDTKKLDKVDIPEEFAQLGYSGLFHREAVLNGTAEEIAAYERRVPCLLPARGWMALRVDRVSETKATVIVVRQDMAAVADAVFMSPPAVAS